MARLIDCDTPLPSIVLKIIFKYAAYIPEGQSSWLDYKIKFGKLRVMGSEKIYFLSGIWLKFFFKYFRFFAPGRVDKLTKSQLCVD